MSFLFNIGHEVVKILLYWCAVSFTFGIPLLALWSWYRGRQKRTWREFTIFHVMGDSSFRTVVWAASEEKARTTFETWFPLSTIIKVTK